MCLYGALQNQAFGGGLGDVFLLTAGLSAAGALLALMLPSRSAHAAASAGAGEQAAVHEMAA
jgi:hypothetical protein